MATNVTRAAFWMHPGHFNRMSDVRRMRMVADREEQRGPQCAAPHLGGVRAALWVSDILRYPLLAGDGLLGTQRCTGSICDDGLVAHVLRTPLTSALYLASPWLPSTTKWSSAYWTQIAAVADQSGRELWIEDGVRWATLPLTFVWTLSKGVLLGAAYGVGYLQSFLPGFAPTLRPCLQQSAEHATPTRPAYNDVSFAELTPVTEIPAEYLFVSQSNHAFDTRELSLWLAASPRKINPHTNVPFSKADLVALRGYSFDATVEPIIESIRASDIRLLVPDDWLFIYSWSVYMYRVQSDAAVREACTHMQNFLDNCTDLRRAALETLLRASDGTPFSELLIDVAEHPSRREVISRVIRAVPKNLREEIAVKNHLEQVPETIKKWAKTMANAVAATRESHSRLHSWLPYIEARLTRGDLVAEVADKEPLLPPIPINDEAIELRYEEAAQRLAPMLAVLG